MKTSNPDFTFNSLGVNRENKILEFIKMDMTNAHSYASATCEVLREEFGVPYGIFKGTDGESITVFKPISRIK